VAKWQCSVCGYIYDEAREDVAFEKLPDDWTCPVCGAPRSAFRKLAGAAEGVAAEGEFAGTVADLIVAQLAEYGVRYVYGIPGDSNLPLVDAIRRSHDVDFVLVRHEETAAFMASARYKVFDELGVCLSIAGPGTTNLITGLLDAATDRSPVLALLGQVTEVRLGSEAFQEIDQLALYHPFTVYAGTVATPARAANVVRIAVKKAYAEHGVAALSLPTDVLAAPAKGEVFAGGRHVFRGRAAPTEGSLRAMAEVIARARRPLVFAGWGARSSGAEVIALAERVGAFVATTSRAKGAVPETHELAVGVMGSIGAPCAARAAQASDLLIILGSGFRQRNLVPNVPAVQVDWNAARIGKTFEVEAGAVGDVREALPRLLELIPAKEMDPDYRAKVRGYRDEHMRDVAALRDENTKPVHPGFVVSWLNELMPKNAVVTVDVGDHTYWFYKYFIADGQRTFLSANMASMAFALPAALAASLHDRDRPTFCVAGDGGFGMLMADFTTAVREKLPLKVILFNDGRLKNIVKEQAIAAFPPYGVEFPNADFAAFASSAGGLGVRVAAPGDFAPAVKNALKEKGRPSLIEVMVDPAAMAAPTGVVLAAAKGAEK
jgi:pyruvate oxidase